MEHVQKHAWAPSMFKTISSQWKAFKEYCREANVLTLPMDESEICFFAIWLTSTGRVHTKGSLAQYVSAVRTVHKMLRLPLVPTPSEYGPLDMILKGFRRVVQHPTKTVSYTHLTLPTKRIV